MLVVFHTRYEVEGYDCDINLWFTKAISRPCMLLRGFASQFCFGNKSSSVGMCRDVQSKLNFVNEAQFLLISEDSIFDLNTRLSSSMFSISTFHIIVITIVKKSSSRSFIVQ